MSQFFEGYSISVIPGAVVFAGVISPAALPLGTTQNYAPTGLSNAARLRITTNVGGSAIGGLEPQVDGFYLIIESLGAGDLTILNAAAGSTASWRFDFPDDFVMPPDFSQAIIYELADARWRLA